MQTYDWIVVGNGFTGAAVSYELARQGQRVLLLEQALEPASATRYSYGGIPFWSGTTALFRQLCRETRDRYLQLPEETGLSIELRELDLLLTVPPDQDPASAVERYAAVEIPPKPLTVAEAIALEPQLNPAAIAGALTVKHGHVHPTALVKAYNQGMQALGGHLMLATVTGLVRVGDRVTGVLTPTQAYAAGHVLIAAGAMTRTLLKTAGVSVPVYFTHAEMIETYPLETRLRSLIMPADLTRSAIESEGTDTDTETLWDEAGHEIRPPMLDVGCIQFLDGTVRIGQISRIHTSLNLALDAAAGEHRLRSGITPLIPILATAPGHWRSCQVTFSRDGLPLVGSVPGLVGVSVFSGFTSPFALVPATATHFAQWAIGKEYAVIAQLSPRRFAKDQS
jgi:glycine/D-amino acid oxidase-like deaminating enzyme